MSQFLAERGPTRVLPGRQERAFECKGKRAHGAGGLEEISSEVRDL